ncbi:DUF5937 family protein [Streptomyces collinus]|uniref:DUF5937 family protein n=1 Tax=Streptomyces collinus TaxID=42684 RepID=UPI0036A2D646
MNWRDTWSRTRRRCRTGCWPVLRAADAAFFAEDWRNLRPALEVHAREVRRRLAVRSPADVLSELLPTAARVGPGERVRLDKLQIVEVKVAPRPLVLVPSARVWPHLTVKHEHPSCVAVQYPVPAATPGGQLTLRDLHDRLMALTSPARMELCRHLLGEPSTTSELAARPDVGGGRCGDVTEGVPGRMA